MGRKAAAPAAPSAETADLRRRLGLLDDALENMSNGLCMFDAQGRVVVCNRRYAEILGLPFEDVRPGASVRELIEMRLRAGAYAPGRSADQVATDLWAFLNSDGKSGIEFEHDGRTYEVQPHPTNSGYIVATFRDISDRLKARAVLHESHARLSAILDAMPDCVKIFDEAAQLVYINPRGLQLLEAPDIETLLTSGHVPVPAEYLAECIEVHSRVLAGETVVWSYEIVGMRGDRRHVEAHALPFRMPDGAKAHMSISRDISERKEAEDSLRRSELRLRLVQDATGLADFETGADGLMVASGRFYEQLGLPVSDGPVDSKAWAGQIHPGDLASVIAEIDGAVVRREEAYRGEFRIIRADTGEIRWISCSTSMRFDEHGKLVRTIGAHLDITERKRSEEALMASEERLRLVQEATGLADFEAGPDGIAHVSEALIRQLGLPPGTTRQPLADMLGYVHPDDRELFQGEIQRSLAKQETFQCEFLFVHGVTGEVRWIYSRTKMERNEAGIAVRSIGAPRHHRPQARRGSAARERGALPSRRRGCRAGRMGL